MLWRTVGAIGSISWGGTIASMPANLVDRLWPSPAYGVDLADAMAGFSAPPGRDGRPSVAVNMVTSIDGRAQLAGTAEGLGSRTDRALMRLYRASFDAVVSGAGTLRQTDVWLRVDEDLARRRLAEGRTAQPIGVVVAGLDPVPTDARWFDGDERRVLFVGSENPMADAPNGTELVRAPDPRPSPRWVLDELAARGVGSVLVEGGPRFNAALAADRVIDELYWTIGPHLIGSDALPIVTPFADDGAEPWRARHMSVLRHEDELLRRDRFGDDA